MKLEQQQDEQQQQTVLKKQVKQKIIQAQQEEALFVQTSSLLQSKMEKVEQQLSTSMNGYHIGNHLKNAQINQQVKCPMVGNNTSSPSQNQPPAKAPVNNGNADESIASSYFQAKYGTSSNNNGNGNVDAEATKQYSHRSQSVGLNPAGTRTRSNTQTPEREIRASSQAPVSGQQRRPSFSYLSLLPKDGSFPHRTQPIGDTQTSRRNSYGFAGMTSASSQEQLNKKSNLMVRSNPIGLAEPSVKRDGYAVGKDGSFYRSSEHLFENKRSVSATPDREIQSSNWKAEQRRSSTSSNSSNAGIRTGGGLIETGKPIVQSFLPFGGGGGSSKKGPNYVIKSSRSRSQSRPPAPLPNASSSSSTVTSQTVLKSSNTTSTTTLKSKVESCTSTTTTSTLSTGIAFKELDIALKKVAKEQEEAECVQVTLPRKGQNRRARSLSRNNTETLPDENITISLPGSKRGSRQPSLDREMKRSSRSSSMEIFTGVYEIKVPAKSRLRNGSKNDSKASVNEIHSDTIRLKSGSNDTEETTQVTLKAPLSKHSSRESLMHPPSSSTTASAAAVATLSKNNMQKIDNNSLLTTASTTTSLAKTENALASTKTISSSSIQQLSKTSSSQQQWDILLPSLFNFSALALLQSTSIFPSFYGTQPIMQLQ